MSQTNVSSMHKEEKRGKFISFPVFSTVASQGRCGMHPPDFPGAHRKLTNQQEESSLPCLRAPHSIRPSVPCPWTEAPWHIPQTVSWRNKKHKAKDFPRETFIQQSTNTQQGNIPMWLLARLPLTSDQLSWQEERPSTLKHHKLAGIKDTCIPRPREHRPSSQEQSLLLKRCRRYSFSKSPSSQSRTENSCPQSFHIRQSPVSFCTGQSDSEKEH